jgi:hypothetical protein
MTAVFQDADIAGRGGRTVGRGRHHVFFSVGLAGTEVFLLDRLASGARPPAT